MNSTPGVTPDPPPVTPEQILTYGTQQQRPLHLDANVVAYFGDLLGGLARSTSRGRVRGVSTK